MSDVDRRTEGINSQWVGNDCIRTVKCLGRQSLWSVTRSDARGKLEAARMFTKEMPGKIAWQGDVCHAKQAGLHGK